MVNRYAGTCIECGSTVPANGGTVKREGSKWYVRHLVCDGDPSPDGTPRVIETRTSGGTFIRNARGRCEDAPCCGCCTF